MSHGEGHREIFGTLRELLQSGELATGVKEAGTRVLAEIASKTRILIAGPESAGRDALANALCAQAIPNVELFVADTSAAFDPAAAEICIWCTAAFSSSEVKIWQTVPVSLKKRSFLVPVADVTTVSEHLNEAHFSNFKDFASGEFHGVFPIVLGENIGAQYAALAAKLLDEIAIVVASHRADAADSALTFVDIYGEKAKPPEMDAIGAAATTEELQNAAIRDAVQEGLSVLAGYADNLSPEKAGDDPETLAEILKTCSTAADDLAEAIQSYLKVGDASSELTLLSEDARTAADKILLLSVEGGLEPAVCAVTILLQLRRELEVLNAA